MSSKKFDWMWSIASYGGVRIAQGLAMHVDKLCTILAQGDYFDKDDVKWQYLKESDTDRNDDILGKMKFWDIVVDGQPILKDAARQYVELPKEWEVVKDMIVFRAFKIGDTGVGLVPTGETDGVDVDEAWFG